MPAEPGSLTDDKTGLLLGANGGRDNLILCTATYLTELPEVRLAWRPIVTSFLSQSQALAGLYRREPGNLGENSVDNLVGAVVCASLLGLQTRLWEIYDYAHAHAWCFNVEEPGRFRFKHWYGRFIGIPPFVTMAANHSVGWLGRALYRLALWFNTRSEYGNTSDKCLQYLMNEVVYGKYRDVDQAIERWRGRMLEIYPGGLRELYSIYFGPTHLFAEKAGTSFQSPDSGRPVAGRDVPPLR